MAYEELQEAQMLFNETFYFALFKRSNGILSSIENGGQNSNEWNHTAFMFVSFWIWVWIFPLDASFSASSEYSSRRIFGSRKGWSKVAPVFLLGRGLKELANVHPAQLVWPGVGCAQCDLEAGSPEDHSRKCGLILSHLECTDTRSPRDPANPVGLIRWNSSLHTRL